VRGPDRLGFLGSLLRTLAQLDLVPKEMTIGTRDGQAFDRFLVKTAGGQVPSDRTRQVLAETLEHTVRRRPATRMAAAAG
jgi:UTP:GlnB (protein PII) uridylyltransferase